MARSKSSKKWLQEHFNDHFVKQSKLEGYRSRAAYKLLAIQEKDKIIQAGMHIVDLGAAPGGWSQVAAKLVGDKGHVYALDILSMDTIPNVTVLKGDFREQEILDELLNLLGNQQVDLVISDMAPNISGIKDVDQAGGMYLVDLALDAATKILKNNGCFVVKIFQGEGFDSFLKTVREKFTKVTIRKPEASRARSTEQYIVAKGFKEKG